jgi:hypothetical protein
MGARATLFTSHLPPHPLPDPPNPPSRSFASTWGELIPKEHGVLPRNTDEAIAAAKEKLQAMKAERPGGGAVSTLSTSYSATVDASAKLAMAGQAPEGNLGKAFKVMRTGV